MKGSMRAVVIALTVTVIGGQATIAHAREVRNASFSWVSAEAGLDDGSYVNISAGSDWAEIYYNRGTHIEGVDCGDGTFGFVDSWVEGSSQDASLTVGSRFSSASGTGTVEAFGGMYESCTDTNTPLAETHTVALDWTGEDGPLGKQSGTWSDHVPGSYNSHQRCSGSFRNASAAGTIDGSSVSGGGRVGETTCTEHSNSK